MRTVAIIQARTGSSRLPAKVLLPLGDQPVLVQVVRRLQLAKQLTDIVIATSALPADDSIQSLCESNGFSFFRGDEADVLDRYLQAARFFAADRIVRVTSDCPLIDPRIVDQIVARADELGRPFATNAGPPEERSYPRGLDAEFFSFDLLERAWKNAKEPYQREHVTPYLYENQVPLYVRNQVDLSSHRWTLDTSEDYDLLRAIYQRLYRGKHDFFMPEILELFDRNPELKLINSMVQQKQLKPA